MKNKNSKSFSEIRTGVIGVGSMGKNHARVFNEISNLVAIADPDKVNGPKIAEEYGVSWYEDYNDMLDKVDAVTIAVPTALHRSVAESAALKGVHMLVEKPLAADVKDAKAIIDISNKMGVTLAVGHIERHNPVIEFTKKAIKEKLWGDVITMSAKRVSSFPERIKDVGVIFDLSIHDIDVLLYLSEAKAETVYASGGSYKSESFEDHVSFIINFDKNIQGICETSWLTPMKVRKLSLTCSTHYVELDYVSQTITTSKSTFNNLDESNLFASSLEIEKNKITLPKDEPLVREIRDFLTAIVFQKDPLVTGNEGLENVYLAQAVKDSLLTNRSINLGK